MYVWQTLEYNNQKIGRIEQNGLYYTQLHETQISLGKIQTSQNDHNLLDYS